MGDTGFGPSPLALSKTLIPENRGANSGALSARNDSPNPDLALLIERWPKLHPAIKDQIMAIVRPDPRAGATEDDETDRRRDE
jgi:hypothetical protein